MRISASPESAGAKLAISFKDRGRAMEKAAPDEIGAAFVSSKGKGRGLGVLDVKRMVETVHGGRVEIESEREVGTTVRLVLPKKQPRAR